MDTITSIKEHPILFSTPMVQAILEGRKTQTRRIIKPQPDDSGLWNDTLRPRSIDSDLNGWNGTVDDTGESKEFKCPYGKPGDLLWVRESFNVIKTIGDLESPLIETYHFKAGHFNTDHKRWKPSIHMPKAAARIWLEVTDIRVERVQEISEEDARAEGIELYGPFGEYKGSPHPAGGCMRYRAYQKASRAFQDLWEYINSEESWRANPWVWVVEFKVLSTK